MVNVIVSLYTLWDRPIGPQVVRIIHTSMVALGLCVLPSVGASTGPVQINLGVGSVDTGRGSCSATSV